VFGGTRRIYPEKEKIFEIPKEAIADVEKEKKKRSDK
jgi:hypothetical protein